MISVTVLDTTHKLYSPVLCLPKRDLPSREKLTFVNVTTYKCCAHDNGEGTDTQWVERILDNEVKDDRCPVGCGAL